MLLPDLLYKFVEVGGILWSVPEETRVHVYKVRGGGFDALFRVIQFHISNCAWSTVLPLD